MGQVDTVWGTLSLLSLLWHSQGCGLAPAHCRLQEAQGSPLPVYTHRPGHAQGDSWPPLFLVTQSFAPLPGISSLPPTSSLNWLRPQASHHPQQATHPIQTPAPTCVMRTAVPISCVETLGTPNPCAADVSNLCLGPPRRCPHKGCPRVSKVT